MITVTIFRSALGVNDDTKETIQVEKEQKIKELFPGVDFTNSLISVNGVYQDENYLLKDGDIAAIRLFPEGDNTGAIIGGVLGGILGVVAGVLAVWFSPILIITLPMIIGTAFTWGAVGASVGAGVGEIIQHGNLNRWLGNTNSSASRDQVEQIPQLRGAKNQPAYGNPVPLVLGRHLFTPMYVGKPYTEIGGEDGEDQYFKALYLLGYSKLKVTNLKLGEIGDLASNWETETKDDGDLLIDGAPFLSDGDPHLELIQTNRESNIYPQAVNEEQLSIELTYPQGDKPLDVVRFSARNPMKVQVEFTFPNGLVKYDSSGKLTYFPVSISIKWRVSTPDDSEDFVDFGPIIGPDIVYFNSMSTITRKKAKAMRFIAEKTFSGYSEVSKTGDTRIIEIEIQRVSENSVDTNVLDKVYLTAIRTWMFDSKKSEGGILVPQSPVNERLRGRTARLGFSIKASQNTQGILDALNCIVESKCRTWDKIKKEWSDPEWDIEKQDWTGAGAETPSNNPASVALKLLQSPSMGRKAYPDSMLDLDSFGDFYKWCEENEYYCNGVLTSGKRLDEVLNTVLLTGRAARILNGNRYGLLIDQPREYPVMLLNSQNVLEATNQKNFADLPDGFSISFINEDDGYQQTDISVMNGGGEPQDQSVMEKIELPFITNRAQAIRMAWYQLACRYLRPEIWNRKLSIDGYLIGMGDMVEIQDDTILVGIGEGGLIKELAVENDAIVKIRTDGKFEVSDMAKQYGIKIMQFDGTNPGRIRTIPVAIPEAGTYSDFDVNIPLSDAPPIPHEGDVVAFGIYGQITTKALCFGKKPNGDGTFDMVFIPYQEGIYETDSLEIPPYHANITPPQSPNLPQTILPDPITLPDIMEVLPGMEIAGQAAVMYEVRPSVSIIRRDSDGNSTPNEITCSQIRVEGNSPPETSNLMLQYITSKSGTGILYTGPITVGDWDWIEFILTSGGIEYDRQRVPVLRDGSNVVTLDIENQNFQIFCQYDGVPKEDQLPFSVQANLYLGSNAVDALWSLPGAPRGITVDQNGLITVAREFRFLDDIPRFPAAQGIADPMPEPFSAVPPEDEWPVGQTNLGDQTIVKVQAVFEGASYTRNLRIRKILDGAPGEPGPQGEPAAKYLGKTAIPTATDQVMIQISAGIQSVKAVPNDYVAYVGDDQQGTSPWKKGYLVQWTGSGWAQITDLTPGNSGMYQTALKDILDGAPRSWFSESFIGSLMAETAFIEKLFGKEITIQSDGSIESEGFISKDDPMGRTPAGFKIWANGKAEFNDVTINGGGVFSGDLQAANGTFAGALQAAAGTFAGILSAAGGRFSGELDCDSLLVKIDPSSMQRFPVSGNYPANTSTSSIRNAVYTFMGISGTPNKSFLVDDGYINSVKIKTIEFATTGGNTVFMSVYDINNKPYGFDGNLPSSVLLWFQLGNGLKKIKLVNLSPTAAGESGTVFKDSDGLGNFYLKIKA